MPEVTIEDLKVSDEGTAFLALNNAFAVETSYLEPDAWQGLLGRARFALAVLPAQAFLLAFDQKPAEVSPNFDWFSARFSDFVYIDRVVVAASAHGQGLGKALYERLFEDAAAAGFARITCEVNIDPPNPGSLAFHERMGFAAVGEQRLENGKTVRYFVRELERP